jgi:hypothetical protein
MVDQEKKQIDSLSGCFVRLLWMLLGNAALALLAIFIFNSSQEGILLKNIAFFIIVAVIILARYLDIKYMHGQTAGGIPATSVHFKRYAFIAVPVYVVGLVLAHLLRFIFNG